MRNKNNSEVMSTIVGGIIAVIIGVLIAPLLIFFGAYLCGIIAKITIGKWLVAGFALLGIEIPLESIPLLAGTLGWIGAYFRNTVNYNKTKTE